MGDRAAFLAGERPDDVLMYFAERAVSGVDTLADLGERTDEGVVLVVDGDRGRSAFQSATGLDPMAFAKDAMATEGSVAPDCTGGTCPAADGTGDEAAGTNGGDGSSGAHEVRFVFAFAEERNDEAGGLYAEGDVVHAYVACACGETYSDRWVAGERGP